jgi:hypothetical protein
MLNVFIDEAGDQGFNFEDGSSKHFLIGFAFFPTTRYKECVDSVKQGIAARCGKPPEHLHFKASKKADRKDLLHKMVEVGGKFGYIYEQKEKVYEYLRKHPKVHYNYNQMACYLLESLIKKERVNENIYLFISQRSSDKDIKKGLATYLSTRIDRIIKPNRLYPGFVKPYNSGGADCADFVCSSVYRMIEKGDSQYYEIIKKNTIVSRELFKS